MTLRHGTHASHPRPGGTATGPTSSAEPATGLITDEQLTRAAGPENSDAAVAAQMIGQGSGGPA